MIPPERGVVPEYQARLEQHNVLTVLWRVPLMSPDAGPVDFHHHGTPAISEDGRRVYVGAHNGAFYCVDSSCGKVLWRKVFEEQFDGEPLVHDGIVYVGSSRGQILALRETDGSLIWKYQARASVESRPVVARDQLLVMTDTNALICLDAQTGQWRWSYKREVPPGRFQIKGACSPLVDDAVYVGFSDGYMAKLNLEDGSVQVVRRIAEKGDRFTDMDSTPVLVDGMLLVTLFSRGVIALNRSLEERWVHSADGVSPLTVAGGMAYYCYGSKVEALHLGSAKPQWRFESGEQGLSRPVIARDWLLVSSVEQSLLVLDRTTGKLLQIFNPGKGASGAPAYLRDRVYWVSNGQVLYAMGLVR
ncbi:MAG: PQQ-binding-like beta-propeller repeat protein [Deltaproteobacteria bacterium]|nr:PQQ-binding-like beta-propeller repeat protein [Deltaproteobacteria bacterium]